MAADEINLQIGAGPPIDVGLKNEGQRPLDCKLRETGEPVVLTFAGKKFNISPQFCKALLPSLISIIFANRYFLFLM